jgi:hypothetical protein
LRRLAVVKNTNRPQGRRRAFPRSVGTDALKGAYIDTSWDVDGLVGNSLG